MITPVSLPSTNLSNISDEMTTNPMGSFEDKVRQLFAEYTATVSNEKASLINQVNNIDSSNPASLLEMQNKIGNYNLTMNMISTLTHKSVSAIDTVLKAQ
ncbi:TPA: type III secretion system inner rod subunit SctI [Providencia rettgeri]|uniref:type III secretion system inner rod subunit SctI n=1 Tax=Providencia sp. PROV129 TaxID=2949839 RepID=UPI00234AD943|nr:type III secretion system inner rod subunit SctI [Providencia sp. PROV129]HEC8329697.1 type III secretion system inner rod subunit SctI [Providencia rettgeri]